MMNPILNTNDLQCSIFSDMITLNLFQLSNCILVHPTLGLGILFIVLNNELVSGSVGETISTSLRKLKVEKYIQYITTK